MARIYATLSVDLVEHADCAYDMLEGRSFRVQIESANLYFPNTPTLRGSKGKTEFIIEVVEKLSRVKIDGWVNYAKSRGQETYIAVVVPASARIPVHLIAAVRAFGIGLFTSSNDTIKTIVTPLDLAVNIGIPDLTLEKQPIRAKLETAFGKITDGHIVDGFKDSCLVLEKAAQNHLIKGIKSTRLTFQDVVSAKPITHDPKKIQRKTMGAVKICFEQIVTPNQVDTLTLQALESVLKDRNDATHEGSTPAYMRRIKRNLGKHLLAILNAVRVL